MNPFIWFLFLFTTLICFSTPLKANDANSEVFNSFVDLEFFSLSKSNKNAFDLPAAVYVITSEDIRRSGITELPEAFRMVPGLQVAQLGSSKWAVSSRGFNFQYANKMLVLVDGRSVYTPLFAGTFWDIQDLILENIDRIEIIRGPGGSVWGSNAVNGIINIITKDAGQTQGNEASISASSNKDLISSYTHGGNIDDDSFYRIYAKTARRGSLETVEETDAEDDWFNAQMGFRTDFVGDDDSLSVQGEIKQAEAQNYFSVLPTTVGAPFTFVDEKEKDSVNAHILAKYDKSFSADSNITSQFYFDYDYGDTEIVKRSGYTFDFDLQHEYQLNQINELTWGVGIRYILDDGNPDDVFLKYRDDFRYDKIYSLFLQDRLALAADELYLTLGSKFEHNSYSGFEYQPSVKLEYFPSDNHTIWGSVSRAVRTPNRGELDGTIRGAANGLGYIVNTVGADFDSEELNAYELGYRYRPESNFLIEINGFYNDYGNLRTYESGIIPGGGEVFLYRSLDNNGYGEAYGLETNFKYQVTNNWKLQGSHTFLKMALHLNNGSNDTTFALQEDQAPQHQFKLQSFYNISSDIELDASYYYTDELAIGGANNIDQYSRMDMRLGYFLTSDIDVSLIGRNLLDSRHIEFPAALYSAKENVGRDVLLKVSFSF